MTTRVAYSITGARIAVCPILPEDEPWTPDEDESNDVMKQPYVNSIEGTGANQDVVILYFDSLELMNKQLLYAIACVLAVIERHHKEEEEE